MKLPDSCNEFVSDFVEKKHQLGIEMTDCIDLIQHFCFWLHQNKYTKSILSLLVVIFICNSMYLLYSFLSFKKREDNKEKVFIYININII